MKIVDVIPHNMSGESRQDVGGSIAVNPNNTSEIVIATMTRDPNGGPNAPVFVSTNGGTTWSAKTIVPGDGPTGTGGITVKYARNSNGLYSAIVNGNTFDQLEILRTVDPAAGALMEAVDNTGENVEQPYIAVGTVPSGPDAGKDRLYVGLNDLSATGPFGSGLTSAIRQTMDGLTSAPVFESILLDRRPKTPGALQDLTPPRNGPQVRPAVHKDGTVYAVFYSWKTWADTGQGPALVTADVVVVRDDDWGQASDPYGSLVDSGDGIAGQRVAKSVPLLFDGTLGFEQLGGDLSIAVDPNHSSIVYIAWTEWQTGTAGNQTTIHLQVRRSTNRGQTWHPVGLPALKNAKAPGLAINDQGQVGLIYQQLTGPANNQRWETRLGFSSNAIQWSDTVLANAEAVNLTPFFPFIGDYTNLMTVGKDFYGVFCTLNDPASTHWPQGVHFQRNHNAVSLFDVNNQTPVAPSIDPFFFSTAYIPPTVQLPGLNFIGMVIIILFGIINDGGGVYIDGQGVHIVGPGDPGPVWDYLVSLAEYRLATESNSPAGLEMQKAALQNIVDRANAQIAQINAQL